MYMLRMIASGAFTLISGAVRLIMKPASIICLGLGVYQLYNNNFFSALVYVFLANMILTEVRYRKIEERLNVQEYL